MTDQRFNETEPEERAHLARVTDRIASRFRNDARLSTNQQVLEVLRDTVELMQDRHRKEVAGKERTRLRGELKKMLRNTTLKNTYKEFYEWLGVPQMLKLLKGASRVFRIGPQHPGNHLQDSGTGQIDLSKTATVRWRNTLARCPQHGVQPRRRDRYRVHGEGTGV